MKSAAGVSVDVYDYLVFGREALGKCNLKGMKSAGGLGAVELNVLDKADKNDPHNARRIVAARWWDAPVILDQNRVFTIQCGVTANPA